MFGMTKGKTAKEFKDDLEYKDKLYKDLQQMREIDQHRAKLAAEVVEHKNKLATEATDQKHQFELDEKDRDQKASLKDAIEKSGDVTHKFTLEKEELIADHRIEVKELQFQIKHVVDERVKAAEDKSNVLVTELAVAKKEIECLSKMLDIDADVIDVKELVKHLIDKLPEIRITSSLAAGAPDKGGDKNKGGGDQNKNKGGDQNKDKGSDN